MGKSELEIDAVITWVDGSDQNHLKKRLKVLGNTSDAVQNTVSTGMDKTRFIDNGEIKYCILSIRKFAPWIRTIHLITDDQVPGFLTEEMREKLNVKIVDHREIFSSFEWALPTFNTRSIETAIWRTPGLASRFIYFNDDFVITKKVKPEHFFIGDKVILRGNWSHINSYGSIRLTLNRMGSFFAKKLLGITRSMHLLLQIRSAQLAGFEEKYFRVPHVPHPIRTETLKRFFDDNSDAFENNIKYRFRNMDQFSSIFLANHLEIMRGNAELRTPDDFLMINGEMDLLPILNRKLSKIKNNRVRFICLQGLEIFKKGQRKKIIRTLKRDLGLKKRNILKTSAKENEIVN
ncbi:MAG: hypothetical protein EA390_14000 [Balneolaceae bacterium]|nr:MAG: hypothetical protein EA390_14000 [Balneolaceae bacterium]